MSTEPRNDGRAPDDLREINFVTDFVRTATGSALIEAGGTRVICTASVDEDVPRWMAARAGAGSPPSTRCSPRRPASASAATSPRAAPTVAPSRSSA